MPGEKLPYFYVTFSSDKVVQFMSFFSSVALQTFDLKFTEYCMLLNLCKN